MKRQTVITAMVTLALLLVNIDLTIINIAIPVLTEEFGIPVDTSVLVIITYLLAMAGTLLIFGRLNDMGHAPRLFTLGFWAFLASSALCAAAWSFSSLLLFRFIQGVGGAMFLSTYAVIIQDHVPADDLGKAYGFVGVAAGAGYAVGLFLGGVLLTHFSWRMIFIINIPICFAGVVLSHLLLEKRPARPASSAPFDYAGAVLNFFSFACLMYALHLAYEDNAFHLEAVWWFLAALVLLAVFTYSQKKSPAPLLDLGILKNKPVVLILLCAVCAIVVENMGCFLLPLYFTEAMEFTVAETSYLLIVPAVVTLACSPPAGYLVDRYGARAVSLFSAVGFCGATGAMATFDVHASLAYLVVVLVLFGGMISILSAATMTYLMQHATPESTGVITSLKSLLPVVFTMIGAIVYGGMYTYFKLATAASQTVKAQTAYQNDMLLSLAVCLVSILLLAWVPKGSVAPNGPS